MQNSVFYFLSCRSKKSQLLLKHTCRQKHRPIMCIINCAPKHNVDIIKKCFRSLIHLQLSTGTICCMNLSDTQHPGKSTLHDNNARFKDSFYLISSKPRHIVQQVLGLSTFSVSVERGDELG